MPKANTAEFKTAYFKYLFSITAKYEKKDWQICILGSENIVNIIYFILDAIFIGCF